jgi:hypothetical protein
MPTAILTFSENRFAPVTNEVISALSSMRLPPASSHSATLSVTLLAVFLLAYAVVALLIPNGQWDAYAIWNVRARFLYYGADPFHYPAVAHPDYPLLLPLAVAFGYRLIGATHPLVPIVLHGFVYAGTMWLFRRNIWLLSIVGLVGLQYASYQYADLPLALALLAATVAFYQSRQIGVGLALGIAIHTKNEGLLIAACFLFVWAAAQRRVPWRAVLAFAPFLALLVAFKLWVNVPNDVVGSTGILERLVDVERAVTVLQFVVPRFFVFGSGINLIVISIVLLLRIPIRPTVPLVAALLIFSGYLAIYQITPHDVQWHMLYSYDRLILHLFPTVLYSLLVLYERTQRVLKPQWTRQAQSVAKTG